MCVFGLKCNTKMAVPPIFGAFSNISTNNAMHFDRSDEIIDVEDTTVRDVTSAAVVIFFIIVCVIFFKRWSKSPAITVLPVNEDNNPSTEVNVEICARQEGSAISTAIRTSSASSYGTHPCLMTATGEAQFIIPICEDSPELPRRHSSETTTLLPYLDLPPSYEEASGVPVCGTCSVVLLALIHFHTTTKMLSKLRNISNAGIYNISVSGLVNDNFVDDYDPSVPTTVYVFLVIFAAIIVLFIIMMCMKCRRAAQLQTVQARTTTSQLYNVEQLQEDLIMSTSNGRAVVTSSVPPSFVTVNFVNNEQRTVLPSAENPPSYDDAVRVTGQHHLDNTVSAYSS